MVDRRTTPDILAALGALPKEKTEPNLGADLDSSLNQSPNKPVQKSPERLEETFSRAVQSVVSLGRVLGRRKLIHWLDEIRDTIVAQKEEETAGVLSISDVSGWLRKRLGAASTIRHYLATGRIVEHPYKVDIWTRFNGKPTRIDMWIECKDQKSPIKRKDVLALVRKAVDVFYAAHADKKDFWFDRLMLISSAPFDPKAIEAANRYGVTCVIYDGATYRIEAYKDWQRKPRWLDEAEIALDRLQG
ncbi:MAG: hypothetical protein HQ553_01235 [Chloroflexi bacterium]|nr:hypothetical protein [Chloroflexota bacterium]